MSIDLAALVSKLSPDGREALARHLAAAGASAAAAQDTPGEPVAIIGMGCRFPGAVNSPDDLWRLLLGRGDAIAEASKERWERAGLGPGAVQDDAERKALRWGGFLDDVAGFDAEFFGITPREASYLDPQHRLFLEVGWEALERAGIPPRGLGGSRTGVYLGIAAPDYFVEGLVDLSRVDAYTVTGGAHSTAAGRFSYLLDLRGPSMAIDTACSSSLVALHLAAQSLRSGECELAVVGGVHVMSSPRTTLAMSKSDVLPADGRCRTFDASANGTVRAEGCGVVVVKLLKHAVRDGDRVHAVVRGSAVNQDGRSNGLTAPSGVAQRAVHAEALARAGVAAATVGLVETHGTGTILGDPIEVDALAQVYGPGDEGRCALGAVKSNLGHLEEAAGVAGLIKAVLCLQRAQIPPNLHFRTLNPNITLEGTRFFVPTDTAPWPVERGPRRAAVSSFGMGGTNAHVIVEQAPDPAVSPAAPADTAAPSEAPYVLPLSAEHPAALGALAGRFADWLAGDGASVPLADLAYTLGRRRPHLGERAAVVAADRASAVAGLRAAQAGDPRPGLVSGAARHAAGRDPVWVFSGYGSHWAGMGAGLLAQEPAFAAAIDELEPLIQAEAGYSLREVLREGTRKDLLANPLTVFAMQLGLAAAWRSYGVRPAAVIGHSMGEVTAAVVAGALDLRDGVTVMARRTELLNRLLGTGAMALVGLPVAQVAERIAGTPGISVAIHSSPRATVVAGDPGPVDEFVARWEAEGLLARRVKGADGAGHTAHVDVLLPELGQALAGLAPRPAEVPVYSTALDDPRAPHAFDAAYWAANMRNPVRFTETVAAAIADGHRAFVEVAPHPVVAHSIEEALEDASVDGAVVACSLRRDEPERFQLLAQAALLHCHGVPIGWDRLAPGGAVVDAPTTAWRHRPHWLPPSTAGSGPLADAHPLLGVLVELPDPSAGHLWQGEISLDRLPWLADHRSADAVVLPGTGYCEMALAAACEAYGVPAPRITVHDIDYHRLLVVDDPVTVTTTLVPQSPNEALVEIATASPEGPVVHASARVSVHEAVDAAREDMDALALLHPEQRDAQSVYIRMRSFGQLHGPAFAGLTALRTGDGDGSSTGTGAIGSVLASLVWPETAVRNRQLRMHPALLDIALHGPVAVLPDTGGVSHLPAGIKSLRVQGDPATIAHAHGDLRPAPEGGGFLSTVRMLAADGTVVVELVDVYFRQIDESKLPVSLRGKLYERIWEPRPLTGTPAATTAGTWLLLGEGGARRDALAAALEAAGQHCVDVDGLPPDGDLRGVVFLADAAPHGTRPDETGLDDADLDGAERTVLGAVGALAAAQDFADRHPGATAPRLWLVTRGGQAVGPHEAPDLRQAALRGFGRTVVFEHAQLNPTLLDGDPGIGDPAAEAAVLAAELLAADDADEVAWRAGTRYAAHLAPTSLARSAGSTGSAGAPAPSAPLVRPDGAYLISGGLTGLGLLTARWLAQRGAGCLVLNARRAPSAEAEAAIEEIRAAGTAVDVVLGDISAPDTARRMVEAVSASGTAVRGVVHCAADLDDCVAAALDAERLHRVWAPKATGALRLHQATSGCALDWWVGYSSLASLIGGAGQANYAAASAWVDALAHWRRTRALPGLAVNWGAWSQVGGARELRIAALEPLRPREGLKALEELLAAGRTQAGVGRIHFRALAQSSPQLKDSQFFVQLAATAEQPEAADPGWAGAAALAGLGAAQRREALARRLYRQVGLIMGFPPGELPAAKPLVHLGLDSLMALKIKNAVQADFGLNLPVAAILQGLTLADLEAKIARHLDGPDDAAPAPAEGAAVIDRARSRAEARAGARGRRGAR